MADCPETPVSIHTNADLAGAYKAARTDLKLCNVDKAALRLWAEGMK